MPGRRATSLNVTILVVYLLIFLVVSGLLIWFNFYKNTQAALEVADQLLIEVSEKVLERTRGTFRPVMKLAVTTAQLPEMTDKPNSQHQHKLVPYFLQMLAENPQIYSVYMGFGDGDFYQVLSIAGLDGDARKPLEAPDAAHFAIRHIFHDANGTKQEVWGYLDANRQRIHERVVATPSYDPRSRPWYKSALVRDEAIWTDLYIFHSLRAPGLTIAQRFTAPDDAGARGAGATGVFGIDLTLRSLSQFLASQRVSDSSLAFMFNRDGILTAYPDDARMIVRKEENGAVRFTPAHVSALNEPVVDAIWAAWQESGGAASRLALTVEGQDYLGRVTALPGLLGGDVHLAIVAPSRDFTGSIVRTQRESLLFSLLALLLSVPVIVLVSRWIAAPLRALAQEAEQIREFQLDQPITVHSQVREISQLGSSMNTMKSALRVFGLYVPKDLVRQLIRSGVQPQLGGERRMLTLLFTDIAAFTHTADTMDPEALMRMMSAYFERIGSAIHESGGTIDKFIGDAVMSFWNAPQFDPEHQRHACLASLRCRHISNQLNVEWRAAGQPVLFTRFGLHCGETVVGNVGSSDRMSYTAMGATVNLASRLEALNKRYGTQILVSEEVRQACGAGFVFRSVDRVIPQGVSHPATIYELVGLSRTDHREDMPLLVTQDCIAWCARWEAAYAQFNQRAFAAARDAFAALAAVSQNGKEDTLARLYRDRAEHYAQTPPPDDWSGVEVMQSK